jgi:hypothetical protein
MRRVISILILILSVPCGFGQIRTDVPRGELDSLIQLIPDFQGTTLVDHLNLVAISISQRYPDSCLYYAHWADSLSEKLNYPAGIAEASFNIGNGHYFKNDIKNALIFYFKSLAIIEQFPPSRLLGNVYAQIGLVYYYHFSFEHSGNYLKKAEAVFNSVNDIHSKFYAQRMIFHTLITDSLNENAFQYVIERKNYYKSIDERNYNRALNEMGLIYLALKDSLALDYFKRGIEVAQDSDVRSDISVLVSNIGCFYSEKPNHPDHFTQAKKYFKIGIELEKKTDRYALAAEFCKDFGKLYIKYKKFVSADSVFKEALVLLHKFDSTLLTVSFDDPSVKMRDQVVSKTVRLEIYKNYVTIFRAVGDYKKAFEYEVLRNELNEWIQLNRVKKESEVIQAKYEADKMNQQIAFLSTKNELQQIKALRSIQIVIGVASFFIISGLLTILYFRQKKLKIEQEKTNLQQKLLRSQMNPHFIFNSLASIQNSIINEEPKKASKYLARFSKLVRHILDSSVEEFIPLEQEISTIENYLELQKIRFPEKFDYTIEVDEQLDTESVQIPPMLAQPFIENAIEHGIRHKESKGKIDIRFRLQNGMIELEVEDDGVGRQKAQEILRTHDKDHRSLATLITADRIKAMNRKMKRKISLEIIDLKDKLDEAMGTLVYIKIPYTER